MVVRRIDVRVQCHMLGACFTEKWADQFAGQAASNPRPLTPPPCLFYTNSCVCDIIEPSVGVPSSETVAESIMNYFGIDSGTPVVAPYWMHALQWTILELLPDVIRRPIIKATYTSLLNAARISTAANANANANAAASTKKHE